MTWTMNSERRLTTGDVGRYCHVSRSTVLKWIKFKRLTVYVHPDGQYRITQDALIDFLKAYRMPIDEDLLREVSGSDTGVHTLDVKEEA